MRASQRTPREHVHGSPPSLRRRGVAQPRPLGKVSGPPVSYADSLTLQKSMSSAIRFLNHPDIDALSLSTDDLLGVGLPLHRARHAQERPSRSHRAQTAGAMFQALNLVDEFRIQLPVLGTFLATVEKGA